MADIDDKRDFPGVGDDAFGATDPDMETKLGAELEFRGDVLEAAIAECRAEVENWRDKALRATADLDNFRKRMARERENERQRAGEHIVTELLPAIDDLERAIDHTTAGGDLKHLLAGVEAVHSKLISALQRHGVEVIDPFGQPFDPHNHEAVGQREDAEFPDHTVVEVLRKGYSMGERVLRHAMVIVSTGGPQAGK